MNLHRIFSTPLAAALLFCAFSTQIPSAVLGTPIISASGRSEKYVRTELYFGLSRVNKPDVSEEEFQRFIDEFVTPRFPDGLTVIEAWGQWREVGRPITREHSKVLIVVYPKRSRKANSLKIEEIRSEYKKRFAQTSVMRIDMGKSLEVSF